MKIPMVDLPEDKQQWPQWLEQQIVSKSLGQLVAQLEAFEDRQSSASLQSVCGDKLPAVLQTGLKALSTEQIGRLLRHPKLLLELQEQAFIACSEYWDGLLVADQKSSVALPLVSSAKKSSTVSIKQFGAIAALAAGLLIAVGIWRSMPSGNTESWGLAQVTSLSPTMRDSAYLEKLAELAGQFSKKKPDSTATLLVRLDQFQAGCKTLIASPKPQLKESERIWLEDSCKKWSGEIEQLRVELKNGARDYQQVLIDANQLAETMETALKQKAAESG